MSDYPRLTEMGISEPSVITGYVINSMNRVDVLRIAQKRKKGSLRPTRRTWEFPLIQEGTPDKEKGTIFSTSPVLREVKAELDRLLGGRGHREVTLSALREELQALESEVAMRIRHIQDRLAELDDE